MYITQNKSKIVHFTKVAFGATLVASLVLVGTALVVLSSSSNDDDDRRSDRRRGGGGGEIGRGAKYGRLERRTEGWSEAKVIHRLLI
jgi:hypothetical protein